jgi:4-hydroxy-tetrahydrodipicolinate synthase
MTSLEGIIPILPAPFTEGGPIDTLSLAHVVDAAIERRATAVTMFGLASEFYKLSDAERETCLDVVVESAAGRVPVIVSVTHHATELAVEQARAAEARGANALMLLPPFFLNPPPDSVRGHIEAVASSVALPVVLQWAPAQTGTALCPDDLAAVAARCPNLTHVKVDAYPSAPTIHDIARGTRLRTLVGYSGLDLPDALEAGCSGCMPTVSLAPPLARVQELARLAPAAARILHVRLLPILEFMMQSVEFLIACEKRLLRRRGLIRSEWTRRPRVTLTPDEAGRLDDLASLLEDLP